jgi:uncharacterized protein (DUF2236 family)
MAGRATVRSVAMGPSFDGDLGLFGPESITWRLHAEPILWLSGFRALLLQSLLPRALAGVLQNSYFRQDPWGRLWRTAQFYGWVVYGTTEQAEQAGARVRQIHSRLSGVDPETGEPFRVDEEELLRWIYVTATESFCSTAQRAGLGLSAEDVDQYYDEQRAVARLVGLDPTTVPATAAEIESYYERMRPSLKGGSDARSIARFLAVPTLPWGLGWTPVRPLWIGVAGYGFSLLPAWARRMYGLPGLPTTDLTATFTARVIRSAIRRLPTKAIEGPLYRAALDRAARAARMPPLTAPNEGASRTINETRAAGTQKGKRRSTASATMPISAVPSITPR